MKKTVLFITLSAFLGTVSCKKEEKKTTANPPPPAARTWTIDGTTYTVAAASANDNSYALGDASGGGFGIYFKTFPTASSAYKLNKDIDLDADEVDILIGMSSPMKIGSPHDGVVNVTISDGKVYMKCSGLKFVAKNGSGDSIGTSSFSADVYY